MTYKGAKMTPEQLERAKCGLSPTGAHHWLLPASGHIVRENGMGKCMYCGERRKFHLSWPINRNIAIEPRRQ